MNNKRRLKIKEVKQIVEKAYNMIECARDEEQYCYDNIPDSLQYTDNAEKMGTAIDMMDDVLSDMDNILENLTNLIS